MSTTTDVPTVDDAKTQLDAAAKEATEAAELVAALEEQARDGDPKVTARKIRDAKELADFAALRLDAAHRKLARAQAADLEQTRRTAVDELRGNLAGLDQEFLAEHYAAALGALRQLTGAIVTRNQAIAAGARELAGLGFDRPADLPEGWHAEDGGAVAMVADDSQLDRTWVDLDGSRYAQTSTQDVLLGMVLRLAGEFAGLAEPFKTQIKDIVGMFLQVNAAGWHEPRYLFEKLGISQANKRGRLRAAVASIDPEQLRAALDEAGLSVEDLENFANGLTPGATAGDEDQADTGQ